MCVLRAYFDESGSANGTSGTFVLCGYIGAESDWNVFEPKWQRLLDKPCSHAINLNPERQDVVCRPLGYLHAQEMEGLGSGRFRALGQRNRDYLVHNSVTVITGSSIIGIGSSIDLDAFNRYDNVTRNAMGGDPYRLCFQYVLLEAFQQSKAFLGVDPKEDIAYIFEESPRFKPKLNDIWDKLLADGYRPRWKMGSITFADKKQFKPLQAADRFAYETFRHFQEGDERPELTRLRARQPQGRYFNAEGLALLVEEMRKAGKLK